jgi:acyl carrier protein
MGVERITDTTFARKPGANGMSPIENRVIEVIATCLCIPKDEITPETTWVQMTDHHGMDSLDSVEIIMELESEFDIDIPNSDAEKFKTVGQAAAYIKERVNGDEPKEVDGQ